MLHSMCTENSTFSTSTNPPTHTYAYMHKSSTKRQVHLKCSRHVLGFQEQTKLTLPSAVSNGESILLTLQLLAFTFSFTIPFQLWQSICRSPQRPELGNWSGWQCSQKNTGWLPTQWAKQGGASCSSSAVRETGVLYVRTELLHVQQSWHFGTVLIMHRHNTTVSPVRAVLAGLTTSYTNTESS